MILAFGNKARSGKDTCCQSIIDYYDNKRELFKKHQLVRHAAPLVKRVNFADALRREVTDAINNAGSIEKLLKYGVRFDPFSQELLYKLNPTLPAGCISTMRIHDWVTPEPNPDMTDPSLPHGKHPKLLQWWGTEYRRAQDPDYWVKKYREQVEGFKGIIVTGDMRFRNEVAVVKELGGYAINLSRLNEDGTPFVAPDRDPNHISETELDGYNWDFYIRSKFAALTGEMAITIAEYTRGLEKK